MHKLLTAVILFIVLLLPKKASAVVIAHQNQSWIHPLTVWQVIQELGDNLSGTTDKFTFRVATTRSNLNQFDNTAQNTRLYDKFNNNSFIRGCIPPNSDPADRLRGLTFTTENVPAGFEDVTIDFSCNNYSFIPGHKYLIFITNANISNAGSNSILFGATNYNLGGTDLFTGGGLRYANGNIYDYSNNSGRCNPSVYKWGGTNPWHNGCYVWGTPEDDLYFILTNNSPEPKTPVIFIPGIGGSEMKATQDIVWNTDNGHGGDYSHAYLANEKIWVNQDEAANLGDDDYFDVLRLKPDGVTSEADLSLTGNLTSFGYSDIDSFFTGMGYVKNTNFFVFPYDWRKDVRTTRADLDILIETAKQKTGLSKVNIVAHSLGGLVARNYISDPTKASKVNKLIELGTPHLGVVDGLKAIIYGNWLNYKNPLLPIDIPIIPNTEIKDVFSNLPSVFQLLPSKEYYSFYNNSDNSLSYPFQDNRDIDNNQVTGALNFDQTKSLIKNLNHNMTVFDFGEQFHDSLDRNLNNTNGVKLYEIIGSGIDTLGQIIETWLITWPINLIPIQDEIKVDGDGTIPTYSASLKNNSRDLSGGAQIYYIKQEHSDMTRSTGPTMQTVRSILDDDNSLPVEVASEKISLEGQQLSVYFGDLDLYDDLGNHTGLDKNGEIEINIPHTSYSKTGKVTHAFINKSAKKTTAKVKSSTTTKAKIKIRNYSQDKINKTIFYNDVPVSTSSATQFIVDPTNPNSPNIGGITPSEATGSAALDQTPPKTTVQITGDKNTSGIYTGPVTISLTGTDSESGILRIEYSLDNGQTVNTYSEPFIISTLGITTIQVKAIDKLGNEEIPQTITIEIAAPPTPTSTPTPTPNPTPTPSPSPEPTSTPTPIPTPSPQNPILPVILQTIVNRPKQDTLETPEVLGTSFRQPNLPIKQEEKIEYVNNQNKTNEFLDGLLLVLGGLFSLMLLGFLTKFLKPSPKQMYHPKPNKNIN